MYLQSDTILLAQIYENLQNMSLEIYELYPETFPSSPGLAWQASLKKTGCFN